MNQDSEFAKNNVESLLMRAEELASEVVRLRQRTEALMLELVQQTEIAAQARGELEDKLARIAELENKVAALEQKEEDICSREKSLDEVYSQLQRLQSELQHRDFVLESITNSPAFKLARVISAIGKRIPGVRYLRNLA